MTMIPKERFSGICNRQKSLENNSLFKASGHAT